MKVTRTKPAFAGFFVNFLILILFYVLFSMKPVNFQTMKEIIHWILFFGLMIWGIGSFITRNSSLSKIDEK